MDIVKQCFEFAVSQHQEKGQSYGVYEYKFHLEQVADIAKKYSYLLLLGQIGQVICACYGHDLLEDCCNYNDIFDVFGSEVTEIIYAVTNELGRNRKERAEKTYPKIRKNRLAVFVKLCDRIANTKFSQEQSSDMYRKYKSEYPFFRASLYFLDKGPTRFNPFKDMWDELDLLNDFKP